MFWGLSCESGNRYHKVVDQPFRVSMAVLETRDKAPKSPYVSLMLEHQGREFLLCTLMYNRLLQSNLDLKFDVGEDIVFYVNGEGTIHLSGYQMESNVTLEGDSMEQTTCDKILMSQISDDDDEDEAPELEENLGTDRLLHLDESSDDDEEDDYIPPDDVPDMECGFGQGLIMLGPYNLRNKSTESDDDFNDSDYDEDEQEEILVEDDDDESEEESEDEDWTSDEEDDSLQKETESVKRKKLEPSGPSAKRSKQSNMKSEGSPSKSKNLDQLLTNNLDKSNASVIAQNGEPVPGTSQVVTPATKKNKKNKQKQEKVMNVEQKYSKKLPCGTQVEDVRIGNGPVAKSGKFVHVFYNGTLPDGTMFDSVKRGSRPFGFKLGKGEVIGGWDTGIEGMRVGGKRMLKVPASMGYGKKGMGVIPREATLLFTVELESVN